MLICESERRVKRKPLVNKYRPIAWTANTQTRATKLFIGVVGKNGEDRRLCVYSLISLSHSQMSVYHIQDLRLLLPTLYFELRVNKHYGRINKPFQEWLQELFPRDLVRAKELSNHRFDLLCSLCFPTIDPPQLLCVSKLCALTFLENDGLVQEEAPPPRLLDWYVACLNLSQAHRGSALHPSLPNPNQLLRVAHSIRTKQTQELQHSPRVTSAINVLRLASNMFSLFYPPREANTQSTHPGLPEFLILLKNTHDHKFSEELENVTLLETLWRYTTNITMWSQVIRRKKCRPVAGELNFYSGPCFILI